MTGKRKRPYGLSCLACREKKTACDGVRPKCGGCIQTGEDCLIPPPQRTLRKIHGGSSMQAAATQAAAAQAGTRAGPAAEDAERSSLGSVRYLLERLKRAEDRIRRMEDAVGVDLGALDPLSVPSPDELRDVQEASPKPDTPPPEQVAEANGPKYQLTVDDTGNVVYHGLTGWSLGPQYASPTTPQIPRVPGYADPTFAPFFQALASHKHISVAPDLGDALVQCFFSYQIFETVHQATFLRDMALNGPYFSEFLLMSIYAAATRKIDGLGTHDRTAQGQLFMKLAKEYLAKDVDRRPTIPLIQGLLLLSSTQLAEGNISGGWLHAGMAFTMIVDLGIHLSPDAVTGAAQLSTEERMIRERLFWSAFIWDKSISLALGREPTFAPRSGRNPSSIADFEDEGEAWAPYFRDPMNRPWNLATYCYQPKQRAAWFRFLARLCLILHDVIVELYSTESRLGAKQRNGFVSRTRVKLDELWGDVPSEAKFDPRQPCPPPNVFMFQMLFHATSILLFRQMVGPRDLAQATQGLVALSAHHSDMANQMASAFTSTFGERMTYVAQYSLFVAASFDVTLLDAQPSEVQMAALGRLKNWMIIMEKSSSRVPSIRLSVQYISTSVHAVVSRLPALAATEPGMWILAQREGPPSVPPVAPFDLTGGAGQFDFFELLPYQE